MKVNLFKINLKEKENYENQNNSMKDNLKTV